MSQQVHDERSSLQKEMLTLIERNRQEGALGVQKLEKAIEQIAQVNVQSMRALESHILKQEELMGGLPKTGYWKEAWSKVQDYLSRSRQGADLALIAQAMARQTEVRERLSRGPAPGPDRQA